MKTKIETLQENRVKVTVTIDEASIANQIKKQYKEAANRYTFPGFRRGKAPRPVIDSALGKEYIRALVTDEVMNESYPIAIDEAGLYPIGQPDFDEEKIELVQEGKDYTFDFEVGIMPTLELSSYDPVEIKVPPEKATDEEIDAEIDTLLEHYMEIVPANINTKVKSDNYADLSIKATDDQGENIALLSTDSIQYGLGCGLYPSAFDEELIGLKKGDVKQFSIDMPKETYAMTAPLAGKTSQINFEVQVLSVLKKKMPELTDEWVKNKIGVETIDELRDELRDEINSKRESSLPLLKEQRALDALAERLSAEVPKNVVDDVKETLLKDFFYHLQRQGITLDAYLQQANITSEQFREDIEKQALEKAKQDMALDAFAAHAGIEATEQDIIEECKKNGVANPQTIIDEWHKNGQMYLIRQGVIRSKAVDVLIENVKVSEEQYSKAPDKKGKHAAKSKE